MKQIALLLATLLVSLCVQAQGLPNLTDIRKVTDEVMAKVGKGEIEAGLRTFKPLTIIPEAEFEAMLGQTAPQLPAMTARFGQVIGQEFIREDKLGEHLARFIYIQRFDKHAMRWMFYLYKGKNGWVINTFRFDDKWHELF